MTEPKKLITDSSIARMAGNIAAGFCSQQNASVLADPESSEEVNDIARACVRIALAIVKELETP